MSEMILPGVYIEVRPEGLIIPGRVTIGNLGVVGTASKGPIGKPVLLSSYSEAREVFGDYDAWVDGNSSELTLVRALEIAYNHGASSVYAVRVANAAASASYTLKTTAPAGDNVVLKAVTEGKWGNDLWINVTDADDAAFVQGEEHAGANPAATTLKLNNFPVIKNAQTKLNLYTDANGLTRSLKIIYDDGSAGVPAPAADNEVKLKLSDGTLTFNFAIGAADKLTASYFVDKSKAVKVTLRYGRATQSYTAISGADLANKINDTSGSWITAEEAAQSASLPDKNTSSKEYAAFKSGENGEGTSQSDYQEGLATLLYADAQIMLLAGQNDQMADELDAHCQNASGDTVRHERIAVVGSALGADINDVLGHNVASDRVIFVAPGIKANDSAAKAEVTLPGAYAAAAVAGLLSSFAPHISLTNKTIRVGGLSEDYTSAELTQLLQNRVLPLEHRQGFRIVRGITTSTNTAWTQITTRRIVDYAKIGVRSASLSYIGLLNNERVRGAMRASINSFLAEMVEDEMLISYDLEVSATRDDERKGIAKVTLTLRPTFSIDFIKVTMFLE